MTRRSQFLQSIDRSLYTSPFLEDMSIVSAKRILISLLFVFTLVQNSFSQVKAVTCADLKTGVFHIYPKNSADHFVDIREGEFVRETKINTGDTSLYQIKWLNDCTYSLQYISGTEKMTDETAKFFKKHKLVYEIPAVTNDYYVYKGYVDKASNLPILTDTAWFNEKATAVNNTIYKQATLAEARIKDTSKYSLLYIYRPGKLTNSLADYLIYCDDNAMCVVKNNSGYIFKIFKEERLQLKSRLLKDEAVIDIDVKHGNTYYVKSMIHWGLKSRFYNFKLEMASVSKEVGNLEFQDVKLQ